MLMLVYIAFVLAVVIFRPSTESILVGCALIATAAVCVAATWLRTIAERLLSLRR